MTELRRVCAGLWHWQAYDPTVKCDLSACAVETPEGVFLVDPFPFAEPLPFRPAAVFVTNGNHARAAEAVRQQFGIPIFAPAEAEIPNSQRSTLGSPLAVPGAGPGEVAYLFGKTLCLGDAVINLETHGFALLPEKYRTPPGNLRDSLRKLLSLDFDILTFAHGAPITENAHARLTQLIS